MLVRISTAVAAAVMPKSARPAFHRNWRSKLESMAVLLDRGEMPRSGQKMLRGEVLRMFQTAFEARWGHERTEWSVREPNFALAVLLMVLTGTGLLSNGFQATRHLTDSANLLVPNLMTIAFGLMTGLAMTMVQGLAWGQHYDWRSGGFFVAKTLLVVLLVPLGWLELMPAVRAVTPQTEVGRVLVEVVSRLSFVVGFACAVTWCFADQRYRCPVCLKLMSMPVRIGSWSSVFDPAATEVMCEDGHGTLAFGGRDQWIQMDPSWSELFNSPAPAVRE